MHKRVIVGNIKKSDSHLFKTREIMYAFIDYNRGRYPIELMARTLKIAPRSYYHYRWGA